MTKEELIEKVSSNAGLSKADASRALNVMLNSVKTTLKKGQNVRLVGFGTFSVAKRKAKTGRNPLTGATIRIPARKVPKFSAGKALKDSVK